MELQKIGRDDREMINDFIIRQWFSLQMVVHGESIDLGKAEGGYACEDNEIIGLVTYRIIENDMEILFFYADLGETRWPNEMEGI